MYKYLFTVLLSCLLYSLLFSAWAQQQTVKGQVVSGGLPVPFAHVLAQRPGQKTIAAQTDTAGNFRMLLAAGDYVFVVSAVGFEQRRFPQQIPASAHLLFSIQEISSTLNEVTVTGTMREMKIEASPIHVEVYQPSFFKRNPTPSFFDALQLVNGVRPQLNCSICNTGDIHINGMEGAYTMITIDGMPIVSGLATVYGLSGIPNSMVQRIEVMKGPASALYGSEAMAGLINVITHAPDKVPRFSADVFATSQGEMNYDFALRNKTEKAATLLGINYFYFGNKLDKNSDNFTDVTLQNRVSVFNKWQFWRKQNRVANIAARVVYEDRWGGQLNWNDRFRGSDQIYGETITTNRYELFGVYQLPIRGNWQWQFSLNSHCNALGTALRRLRLYSKLPFRNYSGTATRVNGIL